MLVLKVLLPSASLVRQGGQGEEFQPDLYLISKLLLNIEFSRQKLTRIVRSVSCSTDALLLASHNGEQNPQF